jgi:hypothetical protein
MTNPQRLQAIHEKMARIQWNIAQADRMIEVHESGAKAWQKMFSPISEFHFTRIAINRAIIARLQNYYDNLKLEL